MENSYNFHLSDRQVLSSAHLEFDDRTRELWRSVNYPEPVIEVFDGASGRLKKLIKLKTPFVGGFKKFEDGTFWVQGMQEYFLVDQKGVISKRVKEPMLGAVNQINMISGGLCGNPLIVVDKKLYVTGHFLLFPGIDVNSTGFKNRGIVRVISENGNINYLGKQAPSSLLSYYGASNNYSITKNGNTIILAPFFSNEIQVINLETNAAVFYKGSTKYDSLIKPMCKLADYSKFTNGQANDYYTNNYALVGIVYDRHRDIYYRFIKHPGDKIPIKCSIAVMDRNFKTIFYADLSEDYDPTRFFIDSKGLNIANFKSYKKRQDQLSFDLFKVS